MQRWTRLCIFKASKESNLRLSAIQANALPTELDAIHGDERVPMLHTLLRYRIHSIAYLSPAGYSTVLQDRGTKAAASAHTPSNCVVAIEGIYDNNATLPCTDSHVGVDWTAAPPAAVHRPGFPLPVPTPEGAEVVSRPIDRRSFPVTCFHPYRRRCRHRRTPFGAR